MKYNKPEIMKNAWNIRRTAHVDMSTALRASWALAKAMNEAKTTGEDSGWNYRVTANDWAKGGKYPHLHQQVEPQARDQDRLRG